ncbi:MAG TPA: DUF3570 domain-containing protein [Polyangia bacterium]|nr:DUF3570 domain-containing protein [Polyangia bacterium]
MKRAGFVFLVALVLAPVVARADDYVTVRGAYYREPSTRVIQPTVEVERDSPTGWDVKAHYLVDTITSASVAAGTSADSIFTETRNEAALMVRKRWDRSSLSASYKYSAESDYWSHAFGLTGAQRFWGDTANVAVSLGASLDSLSSRFRTPACAVRPSISCSLDSYFAGLSYTQILSPVALAQVSLESAYITGFQGNLYRQVPDLGYEKLPSTRLRNAFAIQGAYYIPRLSLALRLQYRFYLDAAPNDSSGPNSTDPWHVYSHTVELRVYKTLTQDLSVRLSYRQYYQWGANFWCNAIAQPGCYPQDAIYYSTDPKLGRMYTEYPELELIWQAEALRDVPVLGWIAAGTFTVSYGRYIQSTSFGDAHVLQAGYTLPY